MTSLRPVLRLAANGVVRDGDRVLLTRNGPATDHPGGWTLPGGGLEFGEAPAAAMVREVAEVTGLRVLPGPLLSVQHALVELPWRGTSQHVVRLVFTAEARGGVPRAEVDGSTDAARFVGPAELDSLPVAPWARAALGLVPGPEPVELPAPSTPPPAEEPQPAAPGGAVRRQRLGAYAVVRRGDGVLLTRLSDRTSSPGRWTLPGGGVEHGEHPEGAVVREVAEETGLAVALDELLDVDSIHFAGRSPSGLLEDFHGVRIVYRAHLEPGAADVEPVVVEVDGTTDAAGWFDREELAALPVTLLVERYAAPPMGALS